MRIPSGFQPVTLEQMLTAFRETMPTLGEMLWTHLSLTEEEAKVRIAVLEAEHLVQFAISPSPRHEPSVFIAGAADFKVPADHIFAMQLVGFWDTTGQYDTLRGQIMKPDVPGNVMVVYTPEGPLAIVQSVALRLWRQGLITEEQGRLIAPSKIQLLAQIQEQGVCDFCSTLHPKHAVFVPEFDMMVPVPGLVVPRSESGWAACDTCYDMVKNNQRADLLRRSIEASNGGKHTVAALQTLHGRFWKHYDLKIEAAGIGAGLVDFIEDRIAPNADFVNPALKDKTRRIEALRRMTGLSHDEMEAMQKGDVLYKETAKKLAAWRKKYGLTGNNPQAEQRIIEFLNTMDRPLPQLRMPHWQRAFDQMTQAREWLSRRLPHMEPSMATDVAEDVAGLRVADIYSFNTETIYAIKQAAESIPHDAPLKSIEIPMVQAGWFWFAEPLAVPSAPSTSERTHGLLWQWDKATFVQESPNAKGNHSAVTVPTLRFSAYVVDEKNEERKGQILPSAKWFWPIDLSFHEMLVFNTKWYRQNYGPGGPHFGDPMAIGESHTLKCIGDLSLFFMMACLWFRQTVPGSKRKIEPKLTQEPGQLERHARKRHERELKRSPVIRVIALRKSAAVPEDEREEAGTSGGHKLTVRFVVRGHPRLQPCGPGRADRKLIWVDPYPKGPDGAPFKDSGPRVFAVIR